VRERLSARRTLDRLDGDVLYLLRGLVELPVQRGHVLGLPREHLLERLDPQFRDSAVGFGVLAHDEKALLKLLFGLPAGFNDGMSSVAELERQLNA
jgi:hypothetical protein